MTTSEEALACTLSDRDAEAQALEWVDLQRLATNVAPIESGATMRFPKALAAGIQDLAEREAACCAFLNIVTLVEGDEFVVEITADNADGVGLAGLLAGLVTS